MLILHKYLQTNTQIYTTKNPILNFEKAEKNTIKNTVLHIINLHRYYLRCLTKNKTKDGDEKRSFKMIVFLG